jgi:putative endonuclease
MHFVYILYSPGLDHFYIGESATPDERLFHHQAGHSDYTRRAADWVRVFLTSTPTRHEARIVEKRIKSAKNRAAILRWIRGPDNQVETSVWKDLAG